jgi:hypothetical protein
MRVHVLLACAVIATVLLVAATDGLVTITGTGPFEFQAPHQAALLLIRCGLLYFSLSAVRTSTLQSALLAGAFLSSLAVGLAFYPFLLLALLLPLLMGASPDRISAVSMHAALILALVVSTAESLPKKPSLPREESPSAMVDYWLGRQNLYAARWYAIAWANQERVVAGEGTLTLAKLDWELGRVTQARAVLADVLRRPESDEIHARASMLLMQWDALGEGAP